MVFKIVKKLVYNVLWVLYPLTFLIKRDANIWVFGSNYNKYSDNSKYLFEFISVQKPEITSIWITGDRRLVKQLNNDGFKSLWRYSLKGLYAVAKAGAFIYSYNFTDVNMWLKRGAFKLNLWHGVGLKKVGIDIEQGPLYKIRHPKNIWEKIFARLHSPQLFDKSFYLLATSQIVKANYSRSFGIPENQLFIAGYPRLKPFYETTLKPESWNGFKEIILYMPTFRDGNTDFLTQAIPNPKKLNETCIAENILFVFKLHPVTPQQEIKRFNGYSNIQLLDNKIDVYPILPHTTALVTDYSSVFVDYAVLEKNILIYTHDLEEFRINSRDFYFELDDLTGGKKIESFDEFLSALSNLESNAIPLEKTMETFWQEDSKYASRDIANWLTNQLIHFDLNTKK